MSWRVELRDGDRRRSGDITDWIDRLQVGVKLNEPTIVQFTVAGEVGDRVELGQRLLLSRGDLAVPATVVDREDRDDGFGVDEVRVEAVDDLALLWKAMVFPDPSLPPDDAGQPGYQTRTGAAETVIKEYVEATVGGSAPEFGGVRDVTGGADRTVDQRVDGLVVEEDGGGGATVTGRGRWRLLGEFIAGLADRGDVAFRMVQDGVDLEFQVWEPVDRSASVRISRGIGNLLGWRLRRATPDVTVMVAGGRGEGEDRVVQWAVYGPTLDVFGSRLGFADLRNAGESDDTDQQLRDALDVELDDRLGGADEDLTIDAEDVDAVRWGRDYNVGDLVAVVVRGERIVKQVTEVDVVWTPDGETVKPSVGGSADRRWDLYRRLGFVERQLADLGRS